MSASAALPALRERASSVLPVLHIPSLSSLAPDSFFALLPLEVSEGEKKGFSKSREFVRKRGGHTMRSAA